jgi:hypothetical protein
MDDFRNPPKINGLPVPTKEPEPPITQEEHERRLDEVREWLVRMLVAALRDVPHESLAIFSLDQPGIISAVRRENPKHSAQVALNVPDELVVNLVGPPSERDLVIFVHLPRATADVLEGVSKASIILPS